MHGVCFDSHSLYGLTLQTRAVASPFQCPGRPYPDLRTGDLMAVGWECDERERERERERREIKSNNSIPFWRETHFKHLPIDDQKATLHFTLSVMLFLVHSRHTKLGIGFHSQYTQPYCCATQDLVLLAIVKSIKHSTAITTAWVCRCLEFFCTQCLYKVHVTKSKAVILYNYQCFYILCKSRKTSV